MITIIPSITLIFNSYATTTSNLQVPFEIGDSPNLRILNHPCNPWSSSPQTLLCYVRWLDPLELEKIRTNPQYTWRWKEITIVWNLDSQPRILESNQLTIPTTLKKSMTQRPQWFLEKVFNLKNKWSKRVGDSRENSCKWFSCLGVVMIWSTIYKNDWQVQKFSQKQCVESNHTYFKSYQTCEKEWIWSYEDWYKSDYMWFESTLPRWRLIWFNGLWIISTPWKTSPERIHDTIQRNMIRFNNDTIQETWIVSKCMKHTQKRQKESLIQIKRLWIESNTQKKKLPL